MIFPSPSHEGRFFYSTIQRGILGRNKTITRNKAVRQYDIPWGRTMSSPRYETSCVERFLRYVKINTQSQEGGTRFPSTQGQLTLQQMLAEELREMGAAEVDLDRHGYLFATIPATSQKSNVPCIGLLAHADTTPGISSEQVTPLLHHNYQGDDIVLPNAPEIRIRAQDNPDLRDQIGNTIITASGDTLLGADDKAGIAEILAAAEYLLGHPEIAHGKIRIGITPDQELGRGTQHFDTERFGAYRAYTIDGQGLGQLQTESFCADTLHIEFTGVSAHPGYAKGKLVNAVKLAAEFIHRLSATDFNPEATEGREGFAHPAHIEGNAEHAKVSLLIRSFDVDGLRTIASKVEAIASDIMAEHPGAQLTSAVQPGYRNMCEILDAQPQVVERAKRAIERAGLRVRHEPLRGGTDGSQLCFKGLPTPNLFAGQHNFHSKTEWISTYDMHKAVEVIIELCREWEERTPD